MINVPFLNPTKNFIISTGYLGDKIEVKAANEKDAIVKLLDKYGSDFRWTLVFEKINLESEE